MKLLEMRNWMLDLIDDRGEASIDRVDRHLKHGLRHTTRFLEKFDEPILKSSITFNVSAGQESVLLPSSFRRLLLYVQTDTQKERPFSVVDFRRIRDKNANYQGDHYSLSNVYCVALNGNRIVYSDPFSSDHTTRAEFTTNQVLPTDEQADVILPFESEDLIVIEGALSYVRAENGSTKGLETLRNETQSLILESVEGRNSATPRMPRQYGS